MALPDTLERIGIVVGSALLLALPTSALPWLTNGVGGTPASPAALWLLPGALAGLLVATGRLGVSYHQLWKFSLASYAVAALGPLVGVRAAADPVLGVGWWLVAVGVGALVARVRFRRLTPAAE
ncbi:MULTISPECIES: hypothetical protein [Halorussus]|uniref:hypothetical protein n=1 Tax=Halorussus TaxID=1070314 RepID=UPI000E2145DF|nr:MULTISPECIES: hypothetical protein [Halorussus]NHN60347.1 hypothetical protein [Halorussus sp. JP-T4]